MNKFMSVSMNMCANVLLVFGCVCVCVCVGAHCVCGVNDLPLICSFSFLGERVC